MIRGIDDFDLLGKFTKEFCGIVENHCKYVIVSGYFAIATGRARATEDIDIFIERITEEKFIALHTQLLSIFECIQTDDAHDAFEYLDEGASIRYTYKGIPLPEMEIKFIKDSLDKDQIDNRTTYIEETDMDLYFCPVNSQIAFKEEYLKSDKDIEDAKHLRSIFFDSLNEEEIDRYKKWIREVKM